MKNIFGNDSSGSHGNGHAVYTSSDGPDKLSLRIHVSGHATQTHSVNILTISEVNMLDVGRQHWTRPQSSIPIQEHGWFSDALLFTEICENQPIPTRPGTVCSNWVHDVLATVREHYSMLWVENYGNFV
jgi:hypothetical protein